MPDQTILSQLKILFVEDDENIREQMQIFMRKRTGKFLVAKNGLEGFNLYLENSPDLVISDLKMPIMDGLEMTDRIRKLNKGCPIIITTAFSDVDTILKAVDISIDKYMLKPINAFELVETMIEVYMNKLESRNSAPVIADVIFDSDQKFEIEKNLQNKAAFFIKSHTGKGPKLVKAMIKGNMIELTLKEPFTVMEISLLKNKNNASMVKYSRQTFYNDYKRELENLVSSEIDRAVSLSDISILVAQNREILNFTIN